MNKVKLCTQDSLEASENLLTSSSKTVKELIPLPLGWVDPSPPAQPLLSFQASVEALSAVASCSVEKKRGEMRSVFSGAYR